MEKQQKLFIWTAKLGEKGQIVIPKEAREVFGYKNGDTLLLLGDIDRGIAIAKQEDYLHFAQTILGSTTEDLKNDKDR